jgi:hypothetical protein
MHADHEFSAIAHERSEGCRARTPGLNFSVQSETRPLQFRTVARPSAAIFHKLPHLSRFSLAWRAGVGQASCLPAGKMPAPPCGRLKTGVGQFSMLMLIQNGLILAAALEERPSQDIYFVAQSKMGRKDKMTIPRAKLDGVRCAGR